MPTPDIMGDRHNGEEGKHGSERRIGENTRKTRGGFKLHSFSFRKFCGCSERSVHLLMDKGLVL